MSGRWLWMVVLWAILFPAVLTAQDDEDNPHEEMLDDRFVCLDCHTRLPKAGETRPDYFLVDLPSENCLGCHSEAEHSGVKEHEGKDSGPFPGDENGNVACFTCHDPHPPGSVEGRTVYDAEVNARSRTFSRSVHVPDAENRIHIEALSGEKKKVYLRAPLEHDRLCGKCHRPLKETHWRTGVLWDKFSKFFSYSLP